MEGKQGTLSFPLDWAATDTPSVFRTTFPVSEYKDMNNHVAFSIRQGTRGGPILSFEEIGPKQRERDRLRVEIKVRQDADLSGIQTYLPPLPNMEVPSNGRGHESGLLENRLGLEIAPRIQHVLEAIYMDAAAYLTISSHRIEYTKTAWAQAAKTMKKGLSGKVSIHRLLELQQEAMAQHRKGIAEYEASREKNNQAPVSREIANTSRLYQAAERGLPIELDGMVIASPKEDWENLQKTIQRAQEDGTTDQVFAAAALQSGDYTGLEIQALVNLIKMVREKAGLAKQGGAVQNKLDALVVNPDDFLTRLGLIGQSTSGTQKSRQKARVTSALTSLARKMIKIAPPKKEAADRVVIKGFKTGFFMFEEITADDGENEAGSWKFTALDLLQVRTDDNAPFRSIPTDPFNYIGERADPRYMDDLQRALWDILLAAGFAPLAKQAIALSRFGLAAGDGTPADLAKKKQDLLRHALERYVGGTVTIEHGELEYAPPSPEKAIPADLESGIKKVAEAAARKAAKGEIKKAGKRGRR
jgi:hypothetical protein